MTAGDDDRDVLGHLQAAARELFAAARSALDAADEAVSREIRLLGEWVAGGATGAGTGAPAPSVERIDVEVEQGDERPEG